MSESKQLKLSNFIKYVDDSASNLPDGIFMIRLRELIWSLLIHNATVRNTDTIKRGLLQHIHERTWALATQKELGPNVIAYVTAPTRIKYLKMLGSDSACDYSNKTFDKLFSLVTSASLKNRTTVCQFWWSYCQEFLPEIIDMLAERKDPTQSMAPHFWVWNIQDEETVLANLNISLFRSVYCGRLKILADQLFLKDSNSFGYGKWIDSMTRMIGYFIAGSLAEATAFVEKHQVPGVR